MPQGLFTTKVTLRSGRTFGTGWLPPTFDPRDYTEELAGDPAWGHAIVAVGYDDSRVVANPVTNKKTKGALLIRNSWGDSWGEHGYGWMPYEYVLQNVALDFWSLLKMEYVDSSQFH